MYAVLRRSAGMIPARQFATAAGAVARHRATARGQKQRLLGKVKPSNGRQPDAVVADVADACQDVSAKFLHFSRAPAPSGYEIQELPGRQHIKEQLCQHRAVDVGQLLGYAALDEGAELCSMQC